MTASLPASSRSCRDSRPWAAVHQRPSGRSRPPRIDPSTITSPATRPSTQISPGASGTIGTTPLHNHSPPRLDRGPGSDKRQRADGRRDARIQAIAQARVDLGLRPVGAPCSALGHAYAPRGGPVDCVALGNRSRAPESGREALACACRWAWRGLGCRPLTGTHHRTSVTAHRPRPVLSGRAPRDGVPAPVPFRTEHLLGVVVNRRSVWPER
jgi:hypothetical protein